MKFHAEQVIYLIAYLGIHHSHVQGEDVWKENQILISTANKIPHTSLSLQQKNGVCWNTSRFPLWI